MTCWRLRDPISETLIGVTICCALPPSGTQITASPSWYGWGTLVWKL